MRVYKKAGKIIVFKKLQERVATAFIEIRSLYLKSAACNLVTAFSEFIVYIVCCSERSL